MQFRLLGSVDIEADGECLPLPRRRTRCLLAILLLDVNRIVPVDRLAQLLWEDDPPPRARADIQGHVSRLRTRLTAGRTDPPTLVFAGDGYQLRAEPLAIDAHRFRTLLDQAATSTDLTDRIDQLCTAIGLWRGPALGNAASSWLRERLCADLEERRLTATEDLISAYLAADRAREALPMLAATAAAHPQRESLVALHMRALDQVGRKAEALDVYTRARGQLSDQLGLDPGPNLRNLHQAILRDELPVAVPAQPIRVATPPGSPPGAPISTVVPRQLPADLAGFTGRTAELARLDMIRHGALGSPAAVLVCTIGGAAGVGKTALAVHWAHRALDHFPDGQLYLDLRGFDLSRPPLTPAAAVRALLDALRVPAPQMLTSLEAQTGLYRSLLAGQRMLIVLDNARDAEQVRQLLPGTPGTLVLITSRNQLTSLIATEGANPVNVDLLTPDEARELVARRIGAARVAAEPAAADEIIRRCARLPLALAVVAARAATHPHLSLQTLAEELRNPSTRLDALATPGTSTDVRAAFSWSYYALSAEAARLFRQLGLQPGLDLTVPAAASLAGVPVSHARRNLAELAAASLVIEHAGGRFACHDLLRTYANELARTRDPEEVRGKLTNGSGVCRGAG